MNTKPKLLSLISIVIMAIATFFLVFLYIQNNNLTPIVLHYIYNFGDFLGNRNSLLFIALGSWSFFVFNLYLSRLLKQNFYSLSFLLVLSNIIIASLYLIVSIQIFLNNI